MTKRNTERTFEVGETVMDLPTSTKAKVAKIEMVTQEGETFPLYHLDKVRLNQNYPDKVRNGFELAPYVALSEIEVDTREFEFSHARMPRGRGSWAFFFDDAKKTDDAFWANGTYRDALKAAKHEAQTRGATRVTVGS